MTCLTAPLRAFAEDPNPFLPRQAGTFGHDRRGYHAVVAPGRWVSASRVRLGADELERVVGEVRALARDARDITWSIGPSATPRDLTERLRALGFGAPDPPDETQVAALALDEAPPAVDGIDVRRVETYDDFLLALEIVLEANPWPEEAERRQRAEAKQTYEQRQTRPGGDWIALVDGRPAAAAGAIACAAGLFLVGGSTAPWARGRGCYRALVRARWDEAVRRETPALAVHAQLATSKPILERLGFRVVCELDNLTDRGR